MAAHIAVGAVLHWRNFQFDDGATANKYFIVLGAKPGQHWLFAIATSQSRRKQYVAGCHEKEGYYHIPGGGRDFFPRDTWLLLMGCVEVRPAEALKLLMDGSLTVAGNLRADLANAIRDCLRNCGLPYSDPGWCDVLVPDEVWERINPTHHRGAGLLCFTCIARRCEAAGLDDVPLRIASGPFVVYWRGCPRCDAEPKP